MTYPVGPAPGDAWKLGSISDAQGLDEPSVKAIIRGKNLPPWENAQENMGVYARGEYVHREVVRLDNRIDTVADELGILQIATFGFSGPWSKPAGAFGDIVFDIIAGASGGGRSNNGGSGGTYRGGLGGYSGGWHRLVIPAAQCPAFLNMVVGGPAAGASTDGGSGATGNPSRVVTLDGTVLGEATGGSSAARTYGVGNNTFRMRGGNGASNSGEGIGTQGSRVVRSWRQGQWGVWWRGRERFQCSSREDRCRFWRRWRWPRKSHRKWRAWRRWWLAYRSWRRGRQLHFVRVRRQRRYRSGRRHLRHDPHQRGPHNTTERADELGCHRRDGHRRHDHVDSVYR